MTVGGRPPALDLAGEEPVRVTVYLRPDQIVQLRRLALARREATGEGDVSMLIREAIERAFPPEAKADREVHGALARMLALASRKVTP